MEMSTGAGSDPPSADGPSITNITSRARDVLKPHLEAGAWRWGQAHLDCVRACRWARVVVGKRPVVRGCCWSGAGSHVRPALRPERTKACPRSRPLSGRRTLKQKRRAWAEKESATTLEASIHRDNRAHIPRSAFLLPIGGHLDSVSDQRSENVSLQSHVLHPKH